MHDEDTRLLRHHLGDPALTAGQRRRLNIFQAVEGRISTRIEVFCEETGAEVTDVAVLIIAAAAQGVLFGATPEPTTSVILGERRQLRAFLDSVLPPVVGAPLDPYVDLLESAPSGCVRVLIIDDESMTVLSYGTFLTVELDRRGAAQA